MLIALVEARPEPLASVVLDAADRALAAVVEVVEFRFW